MFLLNNISNTTFLRSKFLKYIVHKARKNCEQYYSTVFSVLKISKNIELWDEATQQAKELIKNEETGLNIFNRVTNEMKQFLLPFLNTDNPVLQSVKQMMYDTKMDYKIHGLVSTLVAKSVGHSSNSSYYEESLQHDRISPQQRKIADALDLSRASFIFHTNILNFSNNQVGEVDKSLQKSNGVAVLVGDFLAANAFSIITSIRDNEVLSVFSKATTDNAEHIFAGETDKNGNFLPCLEHPSKIWKERMYLGHCSLLANGCDAMVHLGGHGSDLRTNAFNFAKHFMFVLKLDQDTNSFKEISKYKMGTPFSLELGPVIMHLDHDPELLKYILDNGKEDISNLNFEKIYSAVQNGGGEEKSINLLKSHATKALSFLDALSKESEAKSVLQDILEALKTDQ